MTTAISYSPMSLRGQSPEAELPLVASQAAIEFDRAIQRRPIGFESACLLGHFIETDAVHDFVAENLVCQALVSSEWKTGLRTFGEATNEASALAAVLAKSASTQPEQWPKLRDFCVAYARQLVRYRHCIRNTLPANPNRR